MKTHLRTWWLRHVWRDRVRPRRQLGYVWILPSAHAQAAQGPRTCRVHPRECASGAVVTWAVRLSMMARVVSAQARPACSRVSPYWPASTVPASALASRDTTATARRVSASPAPICSRTFLIASSRAARRRARTCAPRLLRTRARSRGQLAFGAPVDRCELGVGAGEVGLPTPPCGAKGIEPPDLYVQRTAPGCLTCLAAGERRRDVPASDRDSPLTTIQSGTPRARSACRQLAIQRPVGCA